MNYKKSAIENYLLELVGQEEAGFFKLSAQSYGFYLIQSTNINAQIKSQVESLHKLILQKNLSDPKQLLTELNIDIYSQTTKNYFNLIYGVLDLENNKATYSTAGHYPPPILVKSSNSAKYLPANGHALGAVKQANFENFSVNLTVDNKLIVFSDKLKQALLQENDMQEQDDRLLKIALNLDLKNLNIEKNQDLAVIQISNLKK